MLNIDYYFTPTSPWTYLAHERCTQIAKRHGVADAPAAIVQGKAIFERNTQDAVARPVFGAPAYVLRDELFWGQDRLDFLERALAK